MVSEKWYSHWIDSTSSYCTLDEMSSPATRDRSLGAANCLPGCDALSCGRGATVGIMSTLEILRFLILAEDGSMRLVCLAARMEFLLKDKDLLLAIGPLDVSSGWCKKNKGQGKANTKTIIEMLKFDG